MLKNDFNMLTIKERYTVIEKNFNDIKMDLTSLSNWKANLNVISDFNFKEMLKINSYNEKIFTNAINYDINDNIQKLYRDFLKDQRWYQFASKVIQEFSINEYIPEESLNTVFSAFFNKVFISIKRFLEDYELLSSHHHFLNNILSQLESEVFNIANKAIILEINLKSQNQELQGHTSEQRYENYINSFSEKVNVLEFFEKYPVLLRKISILFLNFEDNSIELLKKIKNDYTKITHFFNVNIGKLNYIEFNAGDTHEHGKSVTLLKFENKTFVFKPKNSSINFAFNQLVETLNTMSKHGSIQLPKCLSVENHSYEEFINYEPSENTSDLKQYYYNFGFLSSVLYYLNANDIHFENIICQKNIPIVVDIETLLQQPWISLKQPENMREIFFKSFHRISRTSLFPNEEVSFGKDTNFGIDMSALTGKFKSDAFLGSTIVNKNTDAIKYESTMLNFEGAQNIPYIGNSTDYYNVFYNQLLDGFSEGSIILKELSENFHHYFDCFHNNQIRVILRNTSQYANILNHLNHPDLLENMLDQEKLLENLWGFDIENKVIIKSEHEQILYGDVPIFFINSDSKILCDSIGNNIGEVYDSSPFEYLKMHLKNNLTDSDIKSQKDLLKLHSPNFYKEMKKKFKKREYMDTSSSFNYLEKAKDIATTIINSSIVSDNSYEWIIPVNAIEDKWSTKIMGNSIYDGKAGVFLFFSTIINFIESEDFDNVYNALCEDIIEVDSIDYNNLGLTSEDLGYFYALSLISDYGRNKLKFRKHIKSILNILEKKESFSGCNLDYINGVFPLINTLFRYYKRFDDRRYLDIAIKIFKDNEIDILNKQWSRSFGHGILSCYYTIILLKNHINTTTFNNMIAFIKNQLSNLNKESKLTWCNGSLGEHILGIEKQTLKLSNIYLKDDSICHGNMGLVDQLISSNEINCACTLLNKVISEEQSNNSYKLFDVPHWKDVSLYTGLSGIGYQILRCKYPGQVDSVLKI